VDGKLSSVYKHTLLNVLLQSYSEAGPILPTVE
jgi:hypothetical protein